MKVAVLSDVHGNSDALAAVLKDIASQSPDATINLGDCFSGPLDVRLTADLLAEADITLTVRGNHDRWLAEAKGDDWDQVARPSLTQEELAWLGALPATAVIDDIFACHACPKDDLTGWLEEQQPDGSRARASLDQISGLAEGIPQSIMLCGHTHMPRAMGLADGRMVVNPGTVGCPGFSDPFASPPVTICTGTPHASYAILERAGRKWTVTHRLVPYDPARMVALAQLAEYQDWASALATGWVQG